MAKLIGGPNDGREYTGDKDHVIYPGPHMTNAVYYRVVAPDGTVTYQYDDERGQDFTL